MKSLLILLVAVIAAPAMVSAQQPGVLPPLVFTSGTAEIRVVPDLADLSFGVEVRHADLKEARKLQAERSVKVLAAIRAAGVAERDLQASQVQIRPSYTDKRQETETVQFYSVSQQFTCTLRDVSKVTDVTAAVVSAGATSVDDANLRTSENRKYRDEARVKAIKAAKEKAVALATELGSVVGKPYSIAEATYNNWGFSQSVSNSIGQGGGNSQPEDDAMSTFAPGTITISATINVSFLLQ